MQPEQPRPGRRCRRCHWRPRRRRRAPSPAPVRHERILALEAEARKLLATLGGRAGLAATIQLVAENSERVGFVEALRDHLQRRAPRVQGT